MYTVQETNRIQQANYNGFRIAAFGRAIVQALYNLTLSFQKAQQTGAVAARNLYDQEAIQRAMFKD